MARPSPVSDFETTAVQFRAIGEFLGGLGGPGQIEELVDILNVGDPIRFEALIAPYGNPRPLCSLMCHVVVEVLSTGSGGKPVWDCWLRSDLDQRQMLEAAQIYVKYFGTTSMQDGKKIPGGAYRNELEAAGFLTCHYGPAEGPLTGAREFVCEQVCPPS